MPGIDFILEKETHIFLKGKTSLTELILSKRHFLQINLFVFIIFYNSINPTNIHAFLIIEQPGMGNVRVFFFLGGGEGLAYNVH